jgi:hypothetical protein
MLPAMTNAGGDILDGHNHNHNHELNKDSDGSEIRNERLAASLRRERDHDADDGYGRLEEERALRLSGVIRARHQSPDPITMAQDSLPSGIFPSFS